MHLKHVIAALAAFSSLAAAAPAQDAKAADKGQGQNQNQNQNQNQDKNNAKGNNNNNNNGKNNKNNGDVNIIQNIIKPNIIVVQENLDKINQLQRQNERELAALVQSQLALATQLQTVKDNIRINHFKAQFPQANTIIVTVTGLVDNRNQGQQNKRYLVNQLLADNGQAGKQTLVMVTDPTNLEISTPQAASAQANAFGAARVQLEDSSSSAGSNTSDFSAQAVGSAPADNTLSLTAFNQAAPFGQIGQSIILPAGTQAPQLLSVPDPAAIILPQQQGLFVQNAGTFLTDCATSAANAANGNPALAGAAAQIFSSFEQIAAAQLAGLSGLGIFNGNRGNNTAQAPPPPPALAQSQGQNLGSIAVGANQGGIQPPPAAAAQPPAQVATPPPPPAQAQGQQGGQNLGSIAVGANQGQPAPAAAPAAQPPAQVAAPPPASQNAPAAQPGAAIVDGANQAIAPVQFGKNPGSPPQAAPASAPAAAPPAQGNTGSGVVVVGSSPGGQSVTQPAPAPPAAVAAGANQAQPAAPPAAPVPAAPAA
ncbi:hypothetical protein CaCOL14_009768 [Colletotrichum acutatum]|uniref:Cas1p-like protein n=1 Tax=Glomerella acutata TaxID=27357 RepID=A0AAD9D2B0_GLOAC|nr:uncharacterized protein BDZ83DRAFT_243560 [Colletotrichum acutatum]KAK1731243.1 hypothetical protein BDZ83DRAFT_243560 [Colletotrichum acutatum]